MAQAFRYPSVTENPKRGSWNNGLDVNPHAAATGHARAENLVVKIDIDDLWSFGFEGFDHRMCDG